MVLLCNPYLIFSLFGLINNVLYVVILSAAVDLVNPATPKSLILLADILPSLLVKLVSPLCIHRLPYSTRIIALVLLSVTGMLLVSLHYNNLTWTLLGIILASISSGFGEVTFLQLTNHRIQHYCLPLLTSENQNNMALNGWSSGTGIAGLVGSLCYFFLTSLCHISIPISLLLFAVLPLGFTLYFKLDWDSQISLETPNSTINHSTHNNLYWFNTLSALKILIIPYMLPLASVYFFEYLINQAISPTLLFPIEIVPFFHNYRDLYVLYSTLYQIGVFISRSSGRCIRLKNLYALTYLQSLNFIVTLLQSWYFINSKWPCLNMLVILWEGLLGGSSYVNTFLNIQDDLPCDQIEFSMGAVSIADSLGIFLASLVGLHLEPILCEHQVEDGRPWCRRIEA